MTDAEEWWEGLSPKQKNDVWCRMARELAASAGSELACKWGQSTRQGACGSAAVCLVDAPGYKAFPTCEAHKVIAEEVEGWIINPIQNDKTEPARGE